MSKKDEIYMYLQTQKKIEHIKHYNVELYI